MTKQSLVTNDDIDEILGPKPKAPERDEFLDGPDQPATAANSLQVVDPEKMKAEFEDRQRAMAASTPSAPLARRVSGVPTPGDLMANYSQTMDMCTMFAAATLMNAKDQTQAKAQVFLAVMKGAEMGLAPASALTEIYVLPGDGGQPKFVVSARAMAGVCVAHGVVVNPPFEGERGQSCSVTVTRHGKAYTSTWTMGRAKVAGLSEKKNWTRHPMEMLRARAIAEACRMACPDLLCGVYVTDEADDERAAARADAAKSAEQLIAEMPEDTNARA